MRKLKIDGRSVLLVRGRVAKVYYSARSPCASSGKVFRFWRLVDGREKSTWHTLEELDEIQAAARAMNTAADCVGTRFAVPTESERAALVLWRKFCRERDSPPRRNFAQILADALSRETEMDETPKIEDAAARFVEWKRGNAAISDGQKRRIAQQIGFFVDAFKGRRLSEVSEEDVVSVVSEKPSIKTRRHYLAEIREMFAWSFRRENASRRDAEKLRNPLELLELPSVPKSAEPKILSPEDGARFFAEAERERADFAAICALCAFCGVRLAEALRLRWRDVRGSEIFLSCAITKTKLARVALVPENAALWLARARESAAPETAVFRHDYGENVREAAFTKMKNSVALRACVSIPRNAFRHTAVSALSRVYGHAAAADACGHDVRTQGVFYRAAMSEEDARAWLSIAPAPCEHGFPRETGEISVPERKDEGEPAPDAPAAPCAP